MDTIGLKADKLASELSLSSDFFDGAEQFSPDRKAYSDFMMSATQFFKDAVKNCNCNEILALEEVAQKHEFRREGIKDAKEAKLSFLNGLRGIKEFWEDSKDSEKMRERFRHDNIDISNNKVKNSIVDSYVRSHSKKMFEYTGINAVPAEKFYYSVRKEAIQLLGKEIQKNIDKALGFERGKGKTLER